jgi:tetratricopeptide (TPR) repeat protein
VRIPVSWRLTVHAAVAAAMLLTACTQDPEARQAALHRGVAALRRAVSPEGTEADLAAAAERLAEAARLNPGNATAFGNLGIACWKLGRLDEAAAAFGRCAELAPGDARPLEFLCQVYIAKDEWEQARLALDRAFQRTADGARILTAMGVATAHAGGKHLARDFLNSALEQDDRYPPALYNMAVLYRDYLDDAETAATFFRRFVEAAAAPGADVHPLRLELAKDNLGLPRAEPAPDTERPDTERPAAPAEPDPTPAEVAAIIRRARQALAGEEADRALIVLKQAVKQYPADPMLVWELATLYEGPLDDPGRAAEWYGRFVASFPEDRRVTEARKRAASCRFAAEHQAAPEMPPDNAIPDPDAALRVWSKGLRLHNAGKWDEAAACYRAALKHDPDLISAWYNLGLVAKTQNRTQEAIDAFEHALGLKPDMVEAEYMLGVTLYDTGRLDDAATHLQRALQMHPQHARAHFVLGLVYRAQDAPERARLHFERTIELAPQSRYADEARQALRRVE